MAKKNLSKMTPRLRRAYKEGVEKRMKDVNITSYTAKKMPIQEFMDKTGFSHSYDYISRGFSEKGLDPSNKAIEDTCRKIGLSFSPIQFKPYDLLD